MVKNPTSELTLDDRLAALQQHREGCLYYAITLTADDDLKIEFATQTQWAGWADSEMRHELRKARPVYSRFVELWEGLGQPYAIVHTADELMLFLLGGRKRSYRKGDRGTRFWRDSGSPRFDTTWSRRFPGS